MKQRNNRKRPVIALLLLLSVLLTTLLACVQQPGGTIFTENDSLDPTGLGLWTYNGKENETVGFSRKNSANIQLTLSIEAGETANYAPERDACAVLFGQYVASALSFDYDAHFKLFPQTLVEEEFTKEVIKHNYTYESALQNIDAVVKQVMPFDRIRVSYRAEAYESALPGTEEFNKKLEHNTGWFEIMEMEPSSIEEIRTYHFDGFTAVINDQYNLGSSESEAIQFFKYNNRWYLWPDLIDNDLSIDLALAEHSRHHGYLEEETRQGVIDRIDGDYVIIGNRAFYAPEMIAGCAVGSEVTVKHYSFGLTVQTEDGKLTIERAFLIQPPTDFIANLYVQDIALSAMFPMNVQHEENGVILGRTLYDKITYTEDFSPTYSVGLLLGVEENSEEADILDAITAQKGCYVFENEQEQKKVVVYKMEGACYLLSFSEGNEVIRIHKTTVDWNLPLTE